MDYITKEKDDIKYIIYFMEKFDPNKIFINLKHGHNNKPISSIWACREDAKYGWLDFCRDNMDRKYKYNKIFSLKTGTRIYKIDNLEDVYNLKYRGYFIKEEFLNTHLDFEKLSKKYDAIEFNNPCIGHFFYNEYETAFNSWDVECLLILNPNIILWD